jgi:hypothetical protein
MTFPFPDNSLMYPGWWSGATTVTITLNAGWSRTMAKENITLFSYGVAFEAGEDWSPAIQPWSSIYSIYKSS